MLQETFVASAEPALIFFINSISDLLSRLLETIATKPLQVTWLDDKASFEAANQWLINDFCIRGQTERPQLLFAVKSRKFEDCLPH